MSFPHEHLLRSRYEELMREAQHDRLVRGMRPARPWHRTRKHPCP
jgi:hypothetical protein